MQVDYWWCHDLCFSSGHIVELQSHVKSFLDLKNRRGHTVYEDARSIHMFNRAFTKRSYNWSFDSSEEEVEELLDEIRSGAIIHLTTSNSTCRGSLHTGMPYPRFVFKIIFCGDEFIAKCLTPLDDEELGVRRMIMAI